MMRRLPLLCLGLALMVTACETHPNKPKEVTTPEVARQDTVVDRIAQLSDSIAMDETREDLYLERAKVYLAKEQVGAAMMDVNRAIELNPRNVDAFLLLSELYYQLGDAGNVTAALDRAMEIDPYDSRPVVKQAEINLLMQNYDLALGHVSNALKLGNYNPEAYFVRGMIYLAKNDTASALKSFMISREQDADFYEPQHEINKIYVAQNNPLTEDFLRATVSHFPNNALSRYELALFLQDHGAPEEALAHYDSLLMIQPENSRFLFNKGYVYFVYLGDNQKALDYFSKSLEVDPTYLDALYNKGHVLEQMGDYVQAKAIYSRVLKQQPNYTLAIDAVNRIANQTEGIGN